MGRKNVNKTRNKNRLTVRWNSWCLAQLFSDVIITYLHDGIKNLFKYKATKAWKESGVSEVDKESIELKGRESGRNRPGKRTEMVREAGPIKDGGKGSVENANAEGREEKGPPHVGRN